MEERKVMMTIQVPESIRKKIKSNAAMSGLFIKDYLIALIEKNDKRCQEKSLNLP